MMILQFIMEHKAAILGILLSISELMALNPKIESSGIFDAIVRMLKSMKQ